ncbi:MAG TPA: SDR family oxidoreductase [Candidatus Baltobacteraceae bacterium]|nr:SDR family oxidoreductase [Candidatus Baltobacteraceae bacterium]
MRVFVTGASGFVGSAVVKELLDAGHQVLGLARSDETAASVKGSGADVQRGDLNDLESLRRGAQGADGVIHTAFRHDFLRGDSSGEDFMAAFAAAAETDRRAIETLGETLAGSGRPLVITSGTGVLAPGRVATEEDMSPADGHPRGKSEVLASELASRGVRTAIVRLPPSVHGDGDHGFVPRLIGIARAKGASGYVGDGANRWAAVHRLDAAVLFRLALEKAPAGSRLHAVGEEGIPLREVASVIGTHLNLPIISVAPDAVADHFGPFGLFVSWDVPASSTLTRERFAWRPTHRGLIQDLEQGTYFTPVVAS